MKCSICKREFESCGVCATCYAAKVMESHPMVKDELNISGRIDELNSKVNILIIALLTKKGVKDLKKQLNIEEIYANSNVL